MKLRMIRKGTFQCHWKSTNGMCGVVPSLNPTYNYICEIECGPILDKHGFLIDQLDVDRYFQDKYKPYVGGQPRHEARSCERIAMECLMDVKYMVESNMLMAQGLSDIRRIAVTIFLNEMAAMSAEWVADEPIREKSDGKQSVKADSGQRGVGAADSVPSTAVGRYEGAVEGQRGGGNVSPRGIVGGIRRVPPRAANGKFVRRDITADTDY